MSQQFNTNQATLDHVKNLGFPGVSDWNAFKERLISNVEDQAIQSFGENRIEALAQMFHSAMFTTMEAYKQYHEQVTQAILDCIDYVANDLNDDNLTTNDELEKLRTLVNTDNALLSTLNNQVQQIPVSTQTGSSSRQPKIGEPPEFSGTGEKVKFTEWMNKITLWIVHENIVTDKARISVAMGKLSGPAAQYMEPWIKKLTTGQAIGTWDEFVDELKVQYGQKDEKEGAKKELTALFSNKDLAHKDFTRYAERFRTLGRLTGYDDELLIDKLLHVIEKDMRLVLIGWKSNNKVPTDWKKFLDLLLNIYKEVHPEKAEGRIFGKNNTSHDQGKPMDVDNINKKKDNKGKKGKEVNSSEKKGRFCHICKNSSHDTEYCRFNGKRALTSNEKEKKEIPRSEDKKRKEDKSSKGKKIRAVSRDESSSDEASSSEDEAPKSQKKKKRVIESSTAFIEEVNSDDDEPSGSSPASDKGKGKKQYKGKDFLRGNM